MISKRMAAVLAATFIPGTAMAQTGFELSYGAVLTSDYISDGESLSDGPALQGYAQLSRGLLYGTVWASTIDQGDDDLEVNLTFGIRPSFGELALDLSYTRYVYEDSGDCCGEIILLAEHPLSESVYAGGAFGFDPENGESWLELASGVNFAEVWTVDGAISSDFGSGEGSREEVVWTLGLSRELGENAWVDLRYHDADFTSGSLAVSVGIDF